MKAWKEFSRGFAAGCAMSWRMLARARTWQLELAAVTVVLLVVTIASDGGWLELVGAAAVALSFCHAQVADRLAEREASRAAGAITIFGLAGQRGDQVRTSNTGLATAEPYTISAVNPVILTLSAVVACHRWAGRYLMSKEALWAVYFVAHHSWSALAGVALFLLYRPWRIWWRTRHPLASAEGMRDTALVDAVSRLQERDDRLEADIKWRSAAYHTALEEVLELRGEIAQTRAILGASPNETLKQAAERVEVANSVLTRERDAARAGAQLRIDTVNASADKAAERLVFALHIYPHYRLDARGPSGCIMRALEEIAPGVAAELANFPADEVYDRRWSEEGAAVPAGDQAALDQFHEETTDDLDGSENGEGLVR